MEFSFSDEPKKGGAPATKVYSPKKKSANRADAAAKSRSRAGTGAAADDAARLREPRQVTAASRIGIIFSGFLLAGMVLFTLTGYERIARAHADINTINSAIELSRLRIKALDVQIECAVTIQDAQQTAVAYGMQYPTQDQYVKIGSAIPFGGAPIGGSAPADGGLGQTVVPDQTDTPAEPTAPTEPTAPAEPAENTPSDD